MPPPLLFCFGLGFSAGLLARRALARGWRVAGTTRSAEKAAALAGEGIEALRFDRAAPLEPLRALLPAASHLLLGVPPDAEGEPVLDRLGAEIAAAGLVWCGYLSTTGVYGDRGGGWVDEEADLRPSSERSRRRVEAEASWQALHRRHGLPLHVFRLAGIYGPGRNPLLSVLDGTARRIDKPGQVFSRIHVEDVAQALEASMAKPCPGRVYNLCDEVPAPAAEVVEFACRLLGREPPPLQHLEEAGLSPMARSFYRDSKRVSNRRIKEELGLELRYPDYRSGLEALLATL